MKRLAVLGHPVAHSRSPAMHSAALAELGLAGEWSYEAIDLAPDELESRVRAMEGEGFVGANVTVPHKGAALSLADTLSETAREIGAANTLSFAAGEVRADNTDAQGLLDALPASPAGKRALVLGAGGAARAVVWALLREGAEVDLWNRTALRAERLCAELGGRPVATPEAGAYELTVNTTAVGLRGEDPFAELAARVRRLRRRTDRRRPRLRRSSQPPACRRRRGGGGGRRRDRGPRAPGSALVGNVDWDECTAGHHAHGRPQIDASKVDPPRVWSILDALSAIALRP